MEIKANEDISGIKINNIKCGTQNLRTWQVDKNAVDCMAFASSNVGVCWNMQEYIMKNWHILIFHWIKTFLPIAKRCSDALNIAYFETTKIDPKRALRCKHCLFSMFQTSSIVKSASMRLLHCCALTGTKLAILLISYFTSTNFSQK